MALTSSPFTGAYHRHLCRGNQRRCVAVDACASSRENGWCPYPQGLRPTSRGPPRAASAPQSDWHNLWQARLTNSALTCVAVFVAVVGNLEKWICGTGGFPVNDLREASLTEMKRGLGVLTDKKLLPSAYDMWEGSRSSGLLRLRYTYDVPRLLALNAAMAKLGEAAVRPLHLDAEESQTCHVVVVAL